MKILIIEDDDSKRRTITAHLKSRGVTDTEIIQAKTMTDFAAALGQDIGLFIIDFNLPSVDQASASQNGRAILEAIIKCGKSDALLLAISSYPGDFPELRAFYEANGCILADYQNKLAWKSTLDHLLVQRKKNVRFDFLIFCALQEERNPYIALLKGQRANRSGIDCYDVTIDGKKGSIILMPQMGLVNSAVTAAICIDRFRPNMVGMSGICGGFDKRAKLGQLFVSSMVYEYQSGKWSTDGFRQEPYQVTTDHQALGKLRSLVDREGLLQLLENGFNGDRPSRGLKPEIGVFTSGSAVIADKKLLAQIETIHRRVNALDMEVYAVQRAAELSSVNPVCICAKTVVDLCDEQKSDDLHSYGSYISAKFLIEAIKYFTCEER